MPLLKTSLLEVEKKKVEGEPSALIAALDEVV
jgi:hypothetical protein